MQTSSDPDTWGGILYLPAPGFTNKVLSMRNGEKLVQKFLETLVARDLDGLMTMVTDDVNYANPPAPAHVGKEAMRNFLAFNFTKATGAKSVIHFWAENEDGSVVMNERTETMMFGKQSAGATFMGVFEIRDGKISAWRDYWDHADFAAKMAKIGQRAGPGIAEKFDY